LTPTSGLASSFLICYGRLRDRRALLPSYRLSDVNTVRKFMSPSSSSNRMTLFVGLRHRRAVSTAACCSTSASRRRAGDEITSATSSTTSTCCLKTTATSTRVRTSLATRRQPSTPCPTSRYFLLALTMH